MLVVEQLQKRLGRFVLRVDRLEIPAGCYFLLLGPSGSGKTVLLETLAGLNYPEQGRVLLEGRDITHEPPERRGVGFVYQRAWLFPHLTVEENIRFGLRCQSSWTSSSSSELARQHTERVRELIELLGIAHLADRLPRKLSGGESQRVAMARALATRPRLLFLDEPLGPLDPAARESLARELLSWHRKFATTTVHVTHDHLEARMLADHVGIVMDGRLAQAGPTDEVFGRPAHRRVARFVGAENIWPGTLARAETGTLARAETGTLARAETGTARAETGTIVRVGSLTLRPSAESAKLLGEAAARPVTVCVRPENISLREPSSFADSGGESPAENCLSARVTELSDRGPMVRLVVEAVAPAGAADSAAGSAARPAFVVYESRAEARRRGRSVGSLVGLSFGVEAVHVMES